MTIDNLKKVHWKLEAFISNLKLKPESQVYELCNELETDRAFHNICHRAKQEIEQLALNKNKEIIKSYQSKFSQCFKDLKSWEDNELKEKFKMNQVNMSLLPILQVNYELTYYYAEFFLDQITILHNKINRYRHRQANILFNYIDHTLKTFCDFLNPIVTINPLKYYDFFFNNIDFERFLKTKSAEEHLDLFNSIYIGLDQIFKRDIQQEITNLQKTIANLSKAELKEFQISTIELRGKLKNSMTNLPEKKKLEKKYNSLIDAIKTGQKPLSIDYQLFIGVFEEDLVFELLNSCEIIIETIKEIIPIKEENQLVQESNAQPHREEKPKYFAKHYVLAYLFDCDANNESYPIGNKKEIERIGNERMGNGKGNTFYKNFNTIINYPNFNTKNEAFLIDLVGENWLNIVTELSTNTELLKKHIEKIKTK
ncbi:MAG: hypothetical protein WD509_01075 [Candidatus Paceibacterota bacterium]